MQGTTETRKIIAAAAKKQALLDEENWGRYHHLYDTAIEVLKTQDVLLYGGSAINSIMPKKYQFYGKFDLPDLDMYCLDGHSISQVLVAKFKERGHAASVQSALHVGTLKVMVDGAAVADLSTVSPVAFAQLAKDGLRGGLGLKTTNPEYLRMTLYEIMSKPVDSRRWEKVFSRLVNFNKVFPPRPAVAKLPVAPIEKLEAGAEIEYQSLLDQLHILVKENQYVLFGADVIALFSGKPGHSVDGTYMDILVDQPPSVVAALIRSEVPSFNLTLEREYKGDMFISDHTFIKYNGRRVMGIYYTGGPRGVCLSYTRVDGYRVATIHTLLHIYYGIYFSKYTEASHAPKIVLLINYLIGLQMKSIGSQRALLQQFAIDCYGHQQKLFTLRREKYLRK